MKKSFLYALTIGISVITTAHTFAQQIIDGLAVGTQFGSSNWKGVRNNSVENKIENYALIQDVAGNYTLLNKANTGAGHIGFRVGNVDRMVILNNGNVGIGTANPSQILQINASNPVISLQHNGTSGGYLQLLNNQFYIGANIGALVLYGNSGIQLSNLSGSGTRMVVADANGKLSSQAIPGIGAGSMHISRDGVGSCCAGSDYTLSLAENTTSTGRTSKIQFHNSGLSEGYLQLANVSGDGSRNFRFGTHQGAQTRVEVQSGLSSHLGEIRFQTSNGPSGNFAIIGSSSNGPDFGIRWKGTGANNELLTMKSSCPNNLFLLSPSYSGSKKVVVNGGIFISNGAACPDYVFKPDYNLMSLPQIEEYIKKNGHLPNIVNETQVLTDGGVDLDVLAFDLWEKIEELTLHAIDLNKKIEAAKQENKDLKNALSKLEGLQARLEKLESDNSTKNGGKD